VKQKCIFVILFYQTFIRMFLSAFNFTLIEFELYLLEINENNIVFNSFIYALNFKHGNRYKNKYSNVYSTIKVTIFFFS
jgi:hypothetical protein